MTDHPNLSDDINANIAKSELLGGILSKDMEPSSRLQVHTKNTLYTILKDAEGNYFIHGGRFSLPTPCCIAGSTWGGSMLKVGFIGVGMHLEFSIMGPGKQRMTYTTSQIKEIIY